MWITLVYDKIPEGGTKIQPGSIIVFELSSPVGRNAKTPSPALVHPDLECLPCSQHSFYREHCTNTSTLALPVMTPFPDEISTSAAYFPTKPQQNASFDLSLPASPKRSPQASPVVGNPQKGTCNGKFAASEVLTPFPYIPPGHVLPLSQRPRPVDNPKLLPPLLHPPHSRARLTQPTTSRNSIFNHYPHHQI